MRTLVSGFLLTLLTANWALGQAVLIPMDHQQSDHLKAYGLAYWALQRGKTIDWLLNHGGGSFLLQDFATLENELVLRNVAFRRLSGSEAAVLIAEVESEHANTAVVRLEKPPRIAVYAPQQTLPWDDAVLLALTYAEVPYDMVYDDEVLGGDLQNFDWLHLHHEDFTGPVRKILPVSQYAVVHGTAAGGGKCGATPWLP